MNIRKCIILILLSIFLLLAFSMDYSYTFASSIENSITGADNFIKNGQMQDKISNENLKNLSDSIFNILLILGTVIAVIVGVLLGIQFITGSVEAKSKVKESLIPYIAGCIVIFGAFGIWKLVVTILGQLT